MWQAGAFFPGAAAKQRAAMDGAHAPLVPRLDLGRVKQGGNNLDAARFPLSHRMDKPTLLSRYVDEQSVRLPESSRARLQAGAIAAVSARDSHGSIPETDYEPSAPRVPESLEKYGITEPHAVLSLSSGVQTALNEVARPVGAWSYPQRSEQYYSELCVKLPQNDAVRSSLKAFSKDQGVVRRCWQATHALQSAQQSERMTSSFLLTNGIPSGCIDSGATPAAGGAGGGDRPDRVGYATKHSWRQPARGLPTDRVPTPVPVVVVPSPRASHAPQVQTGQGLTARSPSPMGSPGAYSAMGSPPPAVAGHGKQLPGVFGAGGVGSPPGSPSLGPLGGPGPVGLAGSPRSGVDTPLAMASSPPHFRRVHTRSGLSPGPVPMVGGLGDRDLRFLTSP